MRLRTQRYAIGAANKLELRRWRPCRWRFLIQPPRIASLFKLLDGVVSYCKSFVFIQPFFQATYDLPGAPKCEGNGVSKDLSPCHARRRYILCKPVQ